MKVPQPKSQPYQICRSRGKTFLFCYVALRDHVNKSTWDLVSGSSSPQVIALQSLVAVGLVEVEIKRFYFVT